MFKDAVTKACGSPNGAKDCLTVTYTAAGTGAAAHDSLRLEFTAAGPAPPDGCPHSP